MPQSTTLKNIEKEYLSVIKRLTGTGVVMTPDVVVELSEKLYNDIKIKGISDGQPDEDMLLFQYGIDDWGDETGEHFSFDITRQFVKQEDIYQLSLSLIFEPGGFTGLESYDCWSCEFGGIDEWITNIKATRGYQMARQGVPLAYEVHFTKV
ncbi:hypothetical protein ACFOTA_14165 [Chitinophaga sp. GCM10012297]|uniref:DUF5348 domain-containing protein n=1 Tax=Chitinophaga chungangae TaxID=2821488 RepID=A0ABS3YF92_9BACT|nr:hypothetical protein [Chitinophaga chungangae]MBO9153362.1 hypothetical protein [Chitinophaga chungangae]